MNDVDGVGTARQRIAIVGSGVSGLVCAHYLGQQHDVVLYEADRRLGGHANTVEVDDPDGPLMIDTGFIVHNDRNYPHLTELFDELGIPARDTAMSFSVTDRLPGSSTNGLSYRATSPNTLFAQRRNLARPAIWRMLRDIARFYRVARQFLDTPDDTTTLDDLIEQHGFSDAFVDLHLIPLGASVWSADPSSFGGYPARSLLTFFDNHGLLGVGRRPQWRVIPGGSGRYVQELIRRFDGEVRLSAPVLAVRRVDDAVDVITQGAIDRFDRVVLAVHSDQALQLVERPTVAEQSVLSAVRFQPNVATLHTDLGLLPPTRRAWAAWNYDRRRPSEASGPATVTYDLTALQHLSGSRRYLLSLNSEQWIEPGCVVRRFEYAHPVYDLEATLAQRRFDEIDGHGGVHYCGAWWGNGFHEDGVVSALRVCERIASLSAPIDQVVA